MFPGPSIFKSFIIILLLIGAIVVIPKYYPSLQRQAGSVLGVQIAPAKEAPLPERITHDVKESVEVVREQGLPVTMKDVGDIISRTDKIIKDYQTAQKELQKTAEQYFDKKEKEEDGK